MLFENIQSEDEESLSSSDGSEISEHHDHSSTGNRRTGVEIIASVEHDTENSESTYSEKDRHARMKRKQREMDKEENSEDDNSSEDSEMRQLKKKTFPRRKRKKGKSEH